MLAIVRGNANLQASLCMVISMMGFTVNDMLVKSLGKSLGTAQIIGVRGVVLSVMILLLIWQRGLLPRLGEAFSWRISLRALMELAAALCFLVALVHMPLANASAILQAIPLAVTLGAALFLGERVGWRRWAAIVVGFAGVLLIVRPGFDGFQPVALLAVAAVVFAAARDLVTRSLPAAVPSLLVSGASAVIIGVIGLLIAAVQNQWQPIDMRQGCILIAAALFLLLGYQFLILAVRMGEMAHVAPYRYTGLLWAIALGFFVFGDVPDAWTLLGSLIVVVTGLFTLYRELRAQAPASRSPARVR